METHVMIDLEEVETTVTTAITTPSEASPTTKKIITTIATLKEAPETPAMHCPPDQATVTTRKKNVTALNPRKSTKQQ